MTAPMRAFLIGHENSPRVEQPTVDANLYWEVVSGEGLISVPDTMVVSSSACSHPVSDVVLSAHGWFPVSFLPRPFVSCSLVGLLNL